MPDRARTRSAMHARLLRAALTALACAACSTRGDDVLHIYTSLDAQEAPTYVDAFAEDTGIRVEWVRLSAGEALARLEAEKHNPRASVWFGGPSPEYIVAAQRGLLQPYQPPLEFALDSAFHGAAWEWTGFYFGAIGFACNEPLLRARAITCPDSWQALLRPELKGQISIAYPYTSGTAYVTMAALLAHMGEARGWEYLRSLDAQVHHYNSSGSAAVTQAGLGEVAVGIAFAHDILKKGVERGYPLSLGMPRDGSPMEIGAVALLHRAPEPELGRRFIDWLLTRRAQDLLAAYYRVPLHPAAQVATGAVTRDDIAVIEYDAAQAAHDQQRILARWRQITGR